ncbi:MAG: type II toxin-antitoxin system RelE/ParE family toxin [Xanthomonadales bacterium]|nr:type II toxin-antitoxin system RelE/ParE family toxin [Xanthomonadales bacterium]
MAYNELRYTAWYMIKNIKCKRTQALYEGKNPKQFRAFKAQTERKLQMLDAAVELLDLLSPLGNKFEKLGGHSLGQYSIRINKQWHICFAWTNEPCAVDITNYH